MDGVAEVAGGRTIGILEPSRERLALLEEWFAAEYRPLLRFAYFVAGDRDLAEDLVQEAFVRLYRAGGRVDEEGLPAYARRTIVNLSRSLWRRRRIERSALGRLHEPEAAPEASPGVRDEVWAAVLALPAGQRAVVALRFYEDMSEAQIARVLGVSAGSVKKQASRAMAKLRAQLGDRREP